MIQQSHFWKYTRKYVINSKTYTYLNTNSSTTYSKIAKTWNSSAHQIITYIYIHTHTHICIYTHFLKPIICAYTYHTCVCIYTHIYIHICVDVCIYMCVYIYIHTQWNIPQS